MPRLRTIIVTKAVVVAAAASFWVYRRWHLRWGATPWEIADAMPGDSLVPAAEFRPTRAITILARPDEVWPWIVQIGYGKAGFYAYDLLDNLGRPSAEQIVPEYQEPNIGDWVAMAPNPTDTTAFKVAGFERDRMLLWSKPDSTLSWRLTPVDDEHTRLVCRIRARYAWRKPIVVLTVPLMELGDFPMSRRELLGIRRRAERMAAERRAQATASTGAPAPVAHHLRQEASAAAPMSGTSEALPTRHSETSITAEVATAV